jgi:membrane associated rhomboid family serine protease
MDSGMQQPGGTAAAATGTKDTFGDGLRRRAWTIGAFVAVIWIVWIADGLLFHGSLLQHGIAPRSIRGLIGIVWAPFLHGSWSHVSSNTVGILLLGGLLILRNEAHFWIVSFLGALAGGLGTWLIGRGDSVHAGASSVVFTYFGYLVLAGIFERRIGSLLLSIVVFFIWGGMLWEVLPTQRSISWEGHICGLLAGAFAAKLLAPRKAAVNAVVPLEETQQSRA